MPKGVSQRKEQKYSIKNMTRTGRRPSGDPSHECSMSLGRCKSSEGSDLMDEDRRRRSESNGSSADERLYIPNDYNGNKKNTINIRIKNNANRNLQHFGGKEKKKEQKSFIKSLIDKIEEMYKKGPHGEKINSRKLPIESRPAFLLNEYINVEPTNSVTYRRRTPHRTLRRSDFIGINLKPFVRFKRYPKGDDSCNNVTDDPKKRAIIKISNQSPHEIFNRRYINANRSSSEYPKAANFYSLKNDVMRGNHLPFWGSQREKNGIGTSIGMHHLGKLTNNEFRDPNMYDTPFVHLNPVQRCATYNPWYGGYAGGYVNKPGGAYEVKGSHPHRRLDNSAEKREHRIRVRIDRKRGGRKNKGDDDGEDGYSERSKTESGSMINHTHHERMPLSNVHNHSGKQKERDLQKEEKKKKILVNLSVPLKNPRGKNCIEGRIINKLGDKISGDAPSHVLFTSKGERGMSLNVNNRASEKIKLRYEGKDGEDKESAKMRSNSTSTCDTTKHNKLLSGTYSSFGESQESCCRKSTKCHRGGLKIHCMHDNNQGGSSVRNDGSNSSWSKTKKKTEIQIHPEETNQRSSHTWSKAPEEYHAQYERGLHNRGDHRTMKKTLSQLSTETEGIRCIRDARAVKKHHMNSYPQLEDNKKEEKTLSSEGYESGESKNECHKYREEKKKDAVKNEDKLLLLTQRNEKLKRNRGKEAPRQYCKMLTWRTSNSSSRSYKLKHSALRKGQKGAKGNGEKSLTCSNSLERQEKYNNLRTITIRSDSVDETSEENPRERHLIKDAEKFREKNHVPSSLKLQDEIGTHDNSMEKYKMVQYYKPGDKKVLGSRFCICEGRVHNVCYNEVEKKKGSRTNDNTFDHRNKVLEIKDKGGRSRSVATTLSNNQRNKKREEYSPEQIGRSGLWTSSTRRGVNKTALPPKEIESTNSGSHYNNGECLYSKEKKKKKEKSNMYPKGSPLCIEGEVNYNPRTTPTVDRYKSSSGDSSRRVHNFVEGTKSEALDCPVWGHRQVDEPENCLWHRTEQAYAPSGEEISCRKNEAHQYVVDPLGECSIQDRASQAANSSCPQKMEGRVDEEFLTNPDFEDHRNYRTNKKIRHRSDLQLASDRKKTARMDRAKKQREHYGGRNSHSHHISKENFENSQSGQLSCTNPLQRKSKKIRSALSGDISARKRGSHSRRKSEMLEWAHSNEGTSSSGERHHKKGVHHEDERYDKGRSRTRWRKESSSDFCNFHEMKNIERVLYNSRVASKGEGKEGNQGGISGRRSRSIDRESIVYYSHGRHPYGDTKEIAERSLYHDSKNNMLSCKSGNSQKNARQYSPMGTTPKNCIHMSHLNGRTMTSKKPTVINSDAHSDQSGGTMDKQVSVERSFRYAEDNQLCSDKDGALIRHIQSKDGESNVYQMHESVCLKGKSRSSNERMLDGRRLHNGGNHQSHQNTLSNEECKPTQGLHNYHDEDEYARMSSRRMRNSRRKSTQRSGNSYSEEGSTDQLAILDKLNSPDDEESDMSRSDHDINLDAEKCGSKERGYSCVERHIKVNTSSTGNVSNVINILRENSLMDKNAFPHGSHSMLRERSRKDIFRKGNGNSCNQRRFSQGKCDFSKNEEHSKHDRDHRHMSFISDEQKESLCMRDKEGRSISLGVNSVPSRRYKYGISGNNKEYSIDGQIEKPSDNYGRCGSKYAHSNRKDDYEESEEITNHNRSPRMKDKKKHHSGYSNKYKEEKKQRGIHKSNRSFDHSEIPQRSSSISEGRIMSYSGRHFIDDKINPSTMSSSNSSFQHEEKKKRIKSTDPKLGVHHGGNRHSGETSRGWKSGHTAQGDRHNCYDSGEMVKERNRGASKGDAEGSLVRESYRRDEYFRVKEDDMSSDRRSVQPAASQLCGRNTKLESIPSVHSNREEVSRARHGSSHERTSEMEKKRTQKENQNSVSHNWIGDEGMSSSRGRENILYNSEKGEITKEGFPSRRNEYPPNVDIEKDKDPFPMRKDSPLMSRTMETKSGEWTKGNGTEEMDKSKLPPMITPQDFNIVGRANAVEGLIRMENLHPNFSTRNNSHQVMISQTVSGVVGLKKANEYMKNELNYYLSGDGSFAKGSLPSYGEGNGKVINSSEALMETNGVKNGIIRVNVDPPKCCSIGAVDTIDSALGEDSDAASRLANYKKGESNKMNRGNMSNISLLTGGQYGAGSLGLPSDNTNMDPIIMKVGSAPLNGPPASNGEEGNFTTFNEHKERNGLDQQNEEMKNNNGMYSYPNVSSSEGVQMNNSGDTSNLRNNNTFHGSSNNAILMNKQYSYISDPTHRKFIHHPASVPRNSNNINGIHYENKAVSMSNLGNFNFHSNLFDSQIGNKICNPVNVTTSEISSVAHPQMNKVPPQQMIQSNFSKALQIPINYGNISNGLIYNSAYAGRNNLLINNQPYGGNIFYDANGRAYIVGTKEEANTNSVKTLGNYGLPTYHLPIDNANQGNLNRDQNIGQREYGNLVIPPAMHEGSENGLKKPSVVL
ncbi:conserved Plasmodium protein, unknown function [Plasmodium knowlesi strain H]|uniref:Uncharacterized protein n=3 Tax=Plasmodium knowlesi TaxID=5850 RepID=A0A5K1UUV2_PLAKH|nr:conserved Plasmodium protein, unknown function [Plasmodium knowlesi strain H]OTN65236.1 Uncharacterized protein PKNOH_S120157600 [Plasmodium knowlesi]CAA9988432.1 conserved Plasmodium protein, unknown function [Plasmodium knowlesi strain H]SBO19881.1 conserved Plasmodium protein, unknown function [Plasmodium knowlesi strain H]SBO20416.1 conserved Plasmodium protein, unknown function [Plasmodium knowlesi strain H]VVS77906.1 conserved Plasmodium protein, unknown function [Plasmodium knowlesi |eukprot:XP_002259413.1 hypothetical protein, conserved in Plasmodium species [Plasmodium knowlesi strain H]